MKRNPILICLEIALLAGLTGCQALSPVGTSGTASAWYYREQLPSNQTYAPLVLDASEATVELALGLPHVVSGVSSETGFETKTVTYRWFCWKEEEPMRFCKVDVEYRRNKDGDWGTVSISKTWD